MTVGDERTALDSALERHAAPAWRRIAFLTSLLLAAGVSLIATIEVERVAFAGGVVTPSGQVRTVQHLEGGIVVEIFVREGDRVAEGDPLLRLDLGESALNPDEIRVDIDALVLERARLAAEAGQLELAFPQDASERQPELAEVERAAFHARRREYESSQSLLQDRVLQRELEIEQIHGRLSTARARRATLAEQFDIAAQLADLRLGEHTAMLTLREALEAVDGEIADLETALPLAQAALSEARERRLFERNRFRSEASTRMRELEIELARLRETLDRAESQAERATVLSPTDGLVNSLLGRTVGGVVRPGEPVAEIVPVGEALVIEARLAPNDIGHVSVGMPAMVKLATYDFMTYGTLSGRIAQIAPDATADENGGHYFRVIIETEEEHLILAGETYPISPGMEASVDIILGRRPVWRYLIEPVLKLREEAFRER